VLQSSLDVENFIRDDILKVIAIDWDRLILNGQGAASEPLGIMQTPGIGSITFGASATYDKITQFETQVANANADTSTPAYVTNPTARGRLKVLAKLPIGATVTAVNMLWEDGGEDLETGIRLGRMNGTRAAATNQIPNNLLLY